MALMGKSSRQSVLDDDASLFQVQEEKSKKQKWSEMNAGQRLHYFIDYYLLKCIICIGLTVFAGIVLWTVLKPQKDRELFFAVVHNSLIPEEREALEQLFTEMFITDPKQQEIRVDDSFPVGYESDAKLSAFLAAQEIDLIVTNEEHFQTLAKNDCFVNLEEFVPEFAKGHSELLYRTEGYSEDTTAEETPSVKHPENQKAYGIIVTGCTRIQKSWYQEEDAILGIVQNCNQPENAASALEKLFLD